MGDEFSRRRPVSDAERIRWQQRAAAELAAILEEGEGLAPISWTVSSLGLMLTGRVNESLVPDEQVRAVFDAWRRLLRLDDVLETRDSDTVTQLRARAQRGGVRVAVTAGITRPGDGMGADRSAEPKVQPVSEVAREPGPGASPGGERRAVPGQRPELRPPRPPAPRGASEGPRP